MLIGLAHTAPFHVGPRNLATLSIQFEILVPRVASTQLSRRDLRAKASLHSSLRLPENRAETSYGLAIRLLDKDYCANQKIPPGILLGLSSSSKGIKDSNGHNGHNPPIYRQYT